MDSSLRGYVLVLVAALAVILPGAVFSQAAGALPVPIAIAPQSAVASGLQSVVTFDARGVPAAANNAGYYSRPVLVSNNTLGGLANGLIRRALPVAAMIAAVEAAGWAIDELTKQVMIPGQAEGLTEGQAAWCLRDGNPPEPLMRCRLTPESWVGYQPTHPSFQFPIVSVAYSSNSGSVSDFEGRSLSITAVPYSSSSHVDETPNSQPTPVSLADLGALVKNNPNLWMPALTNPDGSVNRNPDVNGAARALAQELASGAPAPDPDAEWNTGQQAGNPPPNPSATALDFPAFCSWASVVCDAIDWIRLPADPLQDVGMPIENVPVTHSTWVSGLGNGACPAPRSIGLSMGSFEMSYQAACDLAGYVRPLVIISALLLGAFIVVGAGRQA